MAIVLNSYQDPRAGVGLSEQLGTVRMVQLPATVEDVEARTRLDGGWISCSVNA